jgi:putative PIN family toxin of toxin-antitoxin system
VADAALAAGTAVSDDRVLLPVAVPGAVIDTNIWLDLYVFADPSAQVLADALACGTLKAIRSSATDAELRCVLARPAFAARAGALGPEPLAEWEKVAHPFVPRRAAPWICRDPDDQKFLDLAYSAGAAFLFTKDRALLRLARRARGAGLTIREPRDFAVPG